jgi:hypothetical protein
MSAARVKNSGIPEIQNFGFADLGSIFRWAILENREGSGTTDSKSDGTP